TYLIESILKQAGRRCGVVGTINYRIENEEWPSHNTTPGVIDNQKFLSQLFTRNIDYGVMEVSSHALDQRRVDLIDFKSAVFTNLTSDHLDYHHDRESYFLAKAKLFTSLSREASAIINGDDEFGPRLASLTRARIFTFGVNGPADFVAKDIQLSSTGSRFKLICPQGEIDIKTPLIGLHNVYNITAAAAACWAEKIDIPDIQKGISLLDAVPGRLERVDGHQDFHVFVDYAHTEDGLKNVLSSLRQIGAGRLIVVFGCGGDRDKTKRPKMGKIASEFSDLAIVTSDNPRGEEPQSIVEEILPGFTKNNHLVILDREEAIRHALKMAHKDDIVLIAGKGHENYQIFKDQVIHFDDREVVREILKLKE
ncbi:MAG: UDP-N-acetylmuramoyl-L-alanyl-D-glutamate--2,6-diaminopimelate ligase, partial [Candidatus Omnitrophota bacterium]